MDNYQKLRILMDDTYEDWEEDSYDDDFDHTSADKANDFLAELKSYGNEPEYFGLGFIQLKATNEMRYHFWHPDISPIVSEEEIHDHRYFFASEIIVGELNQSLYVPVEGTDYDLYQVSCDPNNKMDNFLKTVNMQLISTQKFVVGSTYSIETGTYHTVHATKAATRLIRLPIVQEYAHVARKPNSNAVCPFSKKIDHETLWKMIADIVVD